MSARRWSAGEKFLLAFVGWNLAFGLMLLQSIGGEPHMGAGLGLLLLFPIWLVGFIVGAVALIVNWFRTRPGRRS